MVLLHTRERADCVIIVSQWGSVSVRVGDDRAWCWCLWWCWRMVVVSLQLSYSWQPSGSAGGHSGGERGSVCGANTNHQLRTEQTRWWWGRGWLPHLPHTSLTPSLPHSILNISSVEWAPVRGVVWSVKWTTQRSNEIILIRPLFDWREERGDPRSPDDEKWAAGADCRCPVSSSEPSPV